MTSRRLEMIMTLPVGGFHRSSSGFFQRVPDGTFAFLPSIFRLPWHAKQPRIVGPAEIAGLLRTELTETLMAVLLLFIGVHYFFFDILSVYLGALNLPFAVLAHTATMLFGVAAIFYLNNIPFSWMRTRMVADLPVAKGALSPALLDDWQDTRRLWRLSFMTNGAAAMLKKQAVFLYLVMFFCSLPLLLVIVSIMLVRGIGQDSGELAIVFAVYCVLSTWAFLESALVLHRRWKGGRRRRLAAQNIGEVRPDPGKQNRRFTTSV